MKERWKRVVGFSNYAVSDRGRVARIKTKHILSRSPSAEYATVGLKQYGKAHSKKVHTLVLTTFVGPRPPKLMCCHWDGDKTNARLKNLRWGTHQDNADDMMRHNGGRKAPKRAKKKRMSNPTYKRRIDATRHRKRCRVKGCFDFVFGSRGVCDSH